MTARNAGTCSPGLEWLQPHSIGISQSGFEAILWLVVQLVLWYTS